jgi:hypothetical protein
MSKKKACGFSINPRESLEILGQPCIRSHHFKSNWSIQIYLYILKGLDSAWLQTWGLGPWVPVILNFWGWTINCQLFRGYICIYTVHRYLHGHPNLYFLEWKHVCEALIHDQMKTTHEIFEGELYATCTYIYIKILYIIYFIYIIYILYIILYIIYICEYIYISMVSVLKRVTMQLWTSVGYSTYEAFHH